MVTADEIASRSFPTVLRGYDRDAVEAFLADVAATVRGLEDRIAALEERLSAAEAAAADVPPDPFEALGEETARILATAHESARSIQERAQAAADTLRADSEQHATERLAAAQQQAEEQLAAAEQQAAAHLAAAERAAHDLVAEAEARRDAVNDEIRMLEDAREHLLGDLRDAVAEVSDTVTGLEAAIASGAAAATSPVNDDVRVVIDAGHASPAPTDGPADDGGSRGGGGGPNPAQVATDSAIVIELSEAASARAPETPAHPSTGLERDADDEAATADDEAPTADDGAELEPEPLPDDLPDDVPLPVALRDRALAGVQPGMVRRLRRALQEVHNGVLESLHRGAATPDVDALLPDEPALAPVGNVAVMFLTAGYRAGATDGARLAGRALAGDPDVTRVRPVADALADDIAHDLSANLGATLRAGVAAGEATATLSERIGEVFQDLLGPGVDAAVEEHLTRMYGLGVEDVWRGAGIERKVWVHGDAEPRCPAGACRTNANEGPVPLGDEFPSGQQVPPAHAGCTCAIGCE